MFASILIAGGEVEAEFDTTKEVAPVTTSGDRVEGTAAARAVEAEVFIAVITALAAAAAASVISDTGEVLMGGNAKIVLWLGEKGVQPASELYAEMLGVAEDTAGLVVEVELEVLLVPVLAFVEESIMG